MCNQTTSKNNIKNRKREKTDSKTARRTYPAYSSNLFEINKAMISKKEC